MEIEKRSSFIVKRSLKLYSNLVRGQKLKYKIILKGVPASPGVVEGKVKVIKNRKDFSKFKKGNILVTKITDPTMMGIIIKASAIVTDIGGLTSHPAIVAREIGIPCVVGTKKATKILKDGMKIKVDGKRGIVYEIKK
jgi:pyruvate,water dikinase